MCPAAITAIVSGDFNADGKADLAFLVDSFGESPPNGLYIALGKGDGTFQAPFLLDSSAINGGYLTAADLNGDGKTDLIVVPETEDYTSTNVLIYLSTGTGFSAPTSISTPDSASITTVLAADFNGDGKLDLGLIGTTDEFDFNFYFFSGNKTGAFTYVSTSPLGANDNTSGIALDVNHDGILDLVLTGCCGDANPAVALGKGAGEFYPPQLFVAPTSVEQIASIALHSANYPDLIMGLDNYGPAQVVPVLNHYANAPTVTKAATTVVVDTSEDVFVQGSEDLYFPISVKETSAAGQPEGTVTISYGSTVLQTLTLEGGTAYFDASSAPYAPGKVYTFTVAYSGDNFNLPSTAPVTFTTQYETAITLTVNPVAVTAGQNLTITAKISRVNASGYPTGQIAIFYEGGNAELGSYPIVNGTVTLTVPTTGLPAGEYVLQAGYYGGNSQASLDSDSLSPLVDLSIAPKGDTATDTTLVLSPNPITVGQTGTFTATVVKGSGTGAPTGTVNFFANYFNTTYNLGAFPLNNKGQASVALNTTDLYSGYDYSLYAVYNSNGTTYTSTSPTLEFYLRPVSYLDLSANLTTITPGQTLTFTAEVQQLGYEAQTGSITFLADGVKLATVNLVQGTASYTIPTTGLPAGNYTIGATYSGDQFNGAGTATPITITVQ